MPRTDRIYAVLWTWRKHRIVKTKSEGRRLMQLWKWWYERLGWEVRTCGQDAYQARNVETGERHAVAFHEYDAETHERIFKEPRPSKPKTEKPTTHHRRGRKPAWV